MASLQPGYARFGKVSDDLLDLNRSARGLEPQYQKLIAENLMLRLFYELEHAVEVVILKLLTGTPYLDGSSPSLLVPRFRSQDAAKNHIIAALSARRRVYYLEWTTLTKIRNNVNGILNASDHFLTTRNLYDAVYEDMRHVRNHIAHNSASTKARFGPLAQRVYGTTKGINPAKYLLCQRAVVPGYSGNEMAIAQYIKWSRAFLKTLTKSPV